MRFDLADLSLFRHVVEAGSITHGAERAHLALAAASTRIRNMEVSLGAPLLVRRRQGVVPTPAGRTLLQHARVILRQAGRLREDLSAYAGGLAGPAEVLEHDFIGLDRASALQRFLADKAAKIRRPLRLRVQLRSFDAVCRLVESNVGVGIVPETTARWAAKTMAIKTVDLTDPWATRDLTICVRDVDEL